MLENAVEIGSAMLSISKRIDATERARAREYNNGDSVKILAHKCKGTTNCPEPFKSYTAFIEGIQTDFVDIEPQLSKYRARIVELKKMFDGYCDGNDVVMAKLALQSDEDQSSDK